MTALALDCISFPNELLNESILMLQMVIMLQKYYIFRFLYTQQCLKYNVVFQRVTYNCAKYACDFGVVLFVALSFINDLNRELEQVVLVASSPSVLRQAMLLAYMDSACADSGTLNLIYPQELKLAVKHFRTSSFSWMPAGS